MTPLTLARLCAQAYSDPNTYGARGTEVRLTVEDNNVAVSAFRGTTFDGTDIVKDLRALPWYARELGTWCHRGFLVGVRAVWPQLAIPLGRILGPVVLTGHSKGGAEALITGAMMTRLGRPPTKIVTFGCPRAGFAGLGRILEGVPVERYVHGIDIVATVPHRFPFPYRHAGDETRLSSKSPDLFFDHRIAGYAGALAPLPP